jgi:hypothetical protein
VSEEVDLDSQRVAVVDPTAAQVLVLEGAENHSMTTRTDLRATRTPNRPSPHRCLWRSPDRCIAPIDHGLTLSSRHRSASRTPSGAPCLYAARTRSDVSLRLETVKT